jgi:hypothetical protein
MEPIFTKEITAIAGLAIWATGFLADLADWGNRRKRKIISGVILIAFAVLVAVFGS